MEIRKNLVDSSKYSIKCPYTMNPEYITVHNTYNDATAQNEVAYMVRNNNQVSFHIAVDDKEAVQGLPLERNAWHTGDGNGNGNRKSIGVEICYSLSGGDRYYKAEDNAAIVVAQLMKQYNIPINKVRTHQSWNGKYCPHRMLAEGRWDNFIERVQRAYNGKEIAPSNSSPSNEYVIHTNKVVVVTADTLNLRSGAGTNYDKTLQLHEGDVSWITAEQNGWLKDNHGLWMSKQYTREAWRATVTADTLNLRTGPGTNFSKVGSLHAGNVVFFVEEQNGWVKDNRGKWMSKQYLKLG